MNLGLREDWREVIEALTELIDVYRTLNKIISLGRDRKLRREAARMLSRNGKILDAGAGEGSMTEAVLEENSQIEFVTMLDFLPEMLRKAGKRIEYERVVGVYEFMPFRNEVFSAAVTAFALRDSYDMREALRELNRVIKPEGELLILDLSKPDSKLKRSLIGFYWKFVAPFFAFIILGKKGLLANKIYKTYRRLPENSHLIKLLKEYFGKIENKKLFLDGVIISRAVKRSLRE